MTGTTLSQIMVSYLPSIESLRAVTAFVEQGASFVPKKNIQDMLFKTTSSLLLGTQIGVVSKACQGFSQKVEVIKKPKETPVTARIQRVAELLIASSADCPFCRKSTGWRQAQKCYSTCGNCNRARYCFWTK